MSKNKNLHKAKKEKNDEFYTLLSDIEKEMVWYKDFFKDKVVYCNCDDARESNFFKYFSENFELLGLKKLITTGYVPGGNGVVLEYSGDKNGDFMVGDDEITTQTLAGDGDFRSPECIEFLKQADVVVTNPPFSLFREYVAQLMTYGKKFIIMGNTNSIICKEIFSLIKDNKLWFGYSFNKTMKFVVPDDYIFDHIDESGKKIAKVPSIAWYTNVENARRNTPMTLYKKYNSASYPKYDNYNGIDIDKIENIPEDYFGVMGVPLTFLDKYNPDQFELVGIGSGDSGKELGITKNYRGRTDLSYIKDGKSTCPYTRVLIKRKS